VLEFLTPVVIVLLALYCRRGDQMS